MEKPETERSMLKFDYDEAHGEIVTAVSGQGRAANWKSIAIIIGDRAMVLRVDMNTDEIEVFLEPWPSETSDWIPVEELSDAIGSEVGWCWMGRNQRGHLDMFTVGFHRWTPSGEPDWDWHALTPRFCFVGEGSGLTIYRLSCGAADGAPAR